MNAPLELQYYDTAIISRYTGEVDEYGDEVRTILYEGDAQLQPSYTVSNRFDGFSFENEPLLFVPVNDVRVKVNDHIKVETYFGQTFEYTVKNIDPIANRWIPELNNTCIWLKDGKEIDE